MNDRCAGDVEFLEKLGRNDPCPCGSGRRYKRCCLKSGKFDGSLRDYYFQRAPVIRRSYCFCRTFFP
ncbi:SEC-C metal-binding domain-containing protein [Roseibium album]|uniref:SEC-C metal-binding domain-containing protein n=1 Tax=Roseibium album TaxID=311410 RepID=UPI0032977217